MEYLGIPVSAFSPPELDSAFFPLSRFFAGHQKLASRPFAVALERDGGQVAVYETKLIGAPEFGEADRYYLDRLVKFLLWSKGGFRVSLCGNKTVGQSVLNAYSKNNERHFDRVFMERVYERPFEVLLLDYNEKPRPNENSTPIGRHLDGCRIGFDAGGSDRKVSAVIDGKAVYSEETIWHPKQNSDPKYHYREIVEALKTAATKMPQVDAIGVSSAGVYIGNRCRIASLFIKVSDEDFKSQVEDIYLRAAAELGDVPVVVVNDGDVTALAGAMALGEGEVLGIAMGTSEAAGYVDRKGNITGWLNELAFAPLDANPGATRDEWSGDIGCGVKYLSQDGAIKLAANANIPLGGETPAEQLKEIQQLANKGDERARAVFRSLGVYFAHAAALYSEFYEIGHILALGRVTSGSGGDLLLEQAARVLATDYPHIGFSLSALDETTRRVGQSVAAASLPQLK